VAKIIQILLEEKVEPPEEVWNSVPPPNQAITRSPPGTVYPPKASKLRSMTINTLYLTPPHLCSLHILWTHVDKLVLPPSLTLTGRAVRPTGWWDYSNIQRLRLTSYNPNEDITTTKFSQGLLPNLTHFAGHVSSDMTTLVKSLLKESKMRKVAIFGWFNGTDTFTKKRFNTLEEETTLGNAVKSSLHRPWSRSIPPGYFADARQLETIIDGRLLLFDVDELAYTYKMSNDEFWEAIEGL
jgi:hypothetical protein